MLPTISFGVNECDGSAISTPSPIIDTVLNVGACNHSGTVTYKYTYTKCTGFSSTYQYIYTISGGIAISYDTISIDSTVVCVADAVVPNICLLYTSPSPRDLSTSRMPSSA